MQEGHRVDQAEVVRVLSEYLRLNREIKAVGDAANTPKLVARIVELRHPHLPAPFAHLDAFMSLDALMADYFFEEAAPGAEQRMILALSDLVCGDGGSDLDRVRETLLNLWEAKGRFAAASRWWYPGRFSPRPARRRARSTELRLAARELGKRHGEHVAALRELIEQRDP